MRQYKANVAVISSRYGDLERRLLDVFARRPESTTVYLRADHSFAFAYLLADGLLEAIPVYWSFVRRLMGLPVYLQIVMRDRSRDAEFDIGPAGPLIASHAYALTPKGRDFVDRWRHARVLD